MRDFASEARKILKVYLQRGAQALVGLRNGAFDEAEEILRKRAAAFHNFRALDAAASAAGIDLAEVEGLKEMALGIAPQQGELEAALAEAHAETVRQYARIRETRKSIGLYHSTKGEQQGPTRFERAI